MKLLEKIIKILDYLSDVKRGVEITKLSLELNLPRSRFSKLSSHNSY